MHRADLVAVEIAQIGEIEFARRAFANARRIFASLAAIGDAGRVQGVGLFGRSSAAKPMVPPLACVAGSPLIGFDTENTPVLVK